MSKHVDVPRLIAEVRKRPALWDVQHGDHRARLCINKWWQEVAENVGIDVEQCKRKWKNLRDAYRAEIRRSERRLQRDKFIGVHRSQSARYNSKWIHFPALSFLNENKTNYIYSINNDSSNSNSNDDNNQFKETCNDSINGDNFQSVVGEMKLQHNHDMNDSQHLVSEDDDTANDLLFEEFENIATTQAVKRLSATFAMNNKIEQNSTVKQPDTDPSTANIHKCQCSKRATNQINFLQNLGREEQKLMKSTRLEINRSNKLDHIGDADYNFLVSFLPQMKKMSEVQNLKFRAKMCEMVLNILAPTEDFPDTNVKQPICSREQAVIEYNDNNNSI